MPQKSSRKPKKEQPRIILPTSDKKLRPGKKVNKLTPTTSRSIESIHLAREYGLELSDID